ncbi:sigma-70 family RNA polymerase sigma factor [Collimonas antrihumi]|uniref:sigma-70 family RNA polymerase sigma factor n=1 Tax=Collimonas antrihumi TaxID=1940615 RepID=UPI0031B82F1B
MNHDLHRSPLLVALTRHYDELVEHVRRRFGDKSFAREVVNDVCVQLLENPPPENKGTPLALLRHISTCRAIDRYRADAARNAWLESVAIMPDTQIHMHDGESILCGMQTLEALQRAVERLPSRCREVFLLHKIQEMPQQEVAEKLGISRKMVGKHLMRAMTAIMPLMAQCTGVACESTLATMRLPLLALYPAQNDILNAVAKRRRIQRMATMATFCIAIGAIWIVDPAYRTEHIATSTGERSSWTMDDGSEIQLNTDSALTIKSHLRSRRLILDKGEVAFKVAHTYRSFVVQANHVTITDIGTEFNVRNLPAGVRVTVLKGAVQVTSNQQAAVAKIITANQQIDYDDATPAAIKSVDTNQAAAWQRGKLVFDGTSLRQAVDEMQRYRRASISLRGERVAKLRLSGEYSINGLENLIDALPAALPVKIHRGAADDVTISMK